MEESEWSKVLRVDHNWDVFSITCHKLLSLLVCDSAV